MATTATSVSTATVSCDTGIYTINLDSPTYTNTISQIASTNYVTTTPSLNDSIYRYSDCTNPNWDTICVGDIGSTNINWGTVTVPNYYENTEKDKNTMNNEFNFGPYTTKDIKLSLYGMAVRRSDNKWVAYDKESGSLIDVDIFNLNIDSSKVFYKLPKATKSVKPGDVILHNGKPMFVEKVRKDGKFEVVNPAEGTAITILPLKSPFGFDFTTVIVNIADCLPQADSTNPFGALLPFMLDGDSTALMFALMNNKNLKDIDPMILFALGNNNNMSALLLMQMMQGKNPMFGGTVEDPDD